MIKKIITLSSVFLVILLLCALILAVLVIWEAFDMQTAKEIVLKIAYSVFGIYAFSLLLALLTHKKDN